MKEVDIFLCLNNQSAWGNGGEYHYYLTREQAEEKAKGGGWYGGDGQVKHFKGVLIEGAIYFKPNLVPLDDTD